MKEIIIKPKHYAWLDVLRILACFMVIVSHSSDPFIGQFDNNKDDFIQGTFLGSIVRSCVPLFIMISGYLLLNDNLNMTTFYNKRVKRLLLPFVAWAILLPLLYFIYVNFTTLGQNSSLIKEEFTIGATARKLHLFLFNFQYDTIPLWYVYMLFGLYFFLPILWPWLKTAGKKNIEKYLLFWFISLFLPLLQLLAPLCGYHGNYGNSGLLGVCDWNNYGTLYYFSGFIGYMVLAYYLKYYPLRWSTKKTLLLSLILFTVGYVITLVGYFGVHKSTPGNYKNLEVIWNFCGINVALMTLAVYLIFQKLTIDQKPWLTQIASLTFGVYLCHFVVVQLWYDFLYTQTSWLPAFIQIILISTCTFLTCLLAMYLMAKNKFLQKIIS